LSSEFPVKPLDPVSLVETAKKLAEADADLARILDAYGPPPLWDRPPGFGTLVFIILEQQVSLASARAAYNRLAETISPILPVPFLQLDDETLKRIGFSRQKAAYSRNLAQAVLQGDIDLDTLPGLSDHAVRAELVRLKGIGRWTADIYLMEVLLRPDIWPSGDLALAIAVQRVKGLEVLPSPAELEALGERYQPWRSVAARFFWHDYLSNPPRRNSVKKKNNKPGNSPNIP
jgi:DNA-3-methyladenine glycosylase II